MPAALLAPCPLCPPPLLHTALHSCCRHACSLLHTASHYHCCPRCCYCSCLQPHIQLPSRYMPTITTDCCLYFCCTTTANIALPCDARSSQPIPMMAACPAAVSAHFFFPTPSPITASGTRTANRERSNILENTLFVRAHVSPS